MLLTVISVLLATIISLLGTPLIRKLCIRFKIYAFPNQRTIHKQLIPKLGGLSIFTAFFVATMFYAFITENPSNVWSLLVGCGFVLLIGVWDDMYNLSCYIKILGQILAAVVVVYHGFIVDIINLPIGRTLELGYCGPFVSILWIVAITNGLNLLDGVDGLASGFSILIALFIGIVAVIFGNYAMVTLAALLICANIGFLKYNRPPAKIFMGDSGSLFLGFALACISLKVFTLPVIGTDILPLIILFSIPLVDTTLAIFRRISQRKHPFAPDRKHIHHRLLEIGFNQTTTVLIMSTATFICGLICLVLIKAPFQLAFILLSAFSLIFMVFLNQIGSLDFLFNNNTISKKITNVSIHPKENYVTKSFFNSNRASQKLLDNSVKHPHSSKRSATKTHLKASASNIRDIT